VIYGQRAGKKPFPKDKDVYFSSNDGIPDIICDFTLPHVNLLYLANGPQQQMIQTTAGFADS
jgi:hypothetical protein